ncbi:MAG: FIST N-terminal domain-containing protein [Candidatus Heimdallarchaeaceae archaeon]
MKIATGTASHRSIHQVTKNIVKDVIGDMNGTSDFLLVGFTPNYRSKQAYEETLTKLCEESGTSNIVGGTFPGVATSNGYPTTQGCSVMAIKSNDIQVHNPFFYSNIRTNPKRGAKVILDCHKKINQKNKMGLFLTAGPFFEPDAYEQMKILDTFFAHKFKGMFNAIGKIINKNMGRNGFGTANYADEILSILAKKKVNNMIGGATIDLDMKTSFQFEGTNVLKDAMVGTFFSSDKLQFNIDWTFDKSQKLNDFDISEFLTSGYIQKINKKPARQAFIDLIGISEELYNESFARYANASLLYLSALDSEEEDHIPYVSICQSILNGVVTTIPERMLKKKNINADLFTQSGTGIQKSAFECAMKASQNIEKPLFGMFVNCSNRLLIAGDKIEKENVMIREAIGNDVPFITLYSGGEFSVIKNNPVFSAVSLHGMVAGENTDTTKNVVF